MSFLSSWNAEAFYLSFYVCWLFFISIAFGATFFVLIQFATKASWGVTIRRLAENVSLTLPLLCILSVVCYLGRETIYQHWLSAQSFEDHVLQTKRWYLNLPFFYVRSAFYFVIFSVAAIIFSRMSSKQDLNGNVGITLKLQNMSYPFLILCGFAVTFAAFDWIMSLDPHWYSTIFGLYFFAGCYVSFMALASILVFALRKKNPELAKWFNIEHVHDLSKQVFGYSCFWAYAAFSQFLLIWYGNIPEETMWYAVRQSQGWWPIWCLLCIGHFVVPFIFLMSRFAKRTPFILCLVSVWILCMHYLDLYWLIMPNFSEVGPTFGSTDVISFLVIGTLFLAILVVLIKKRHIVPMRDPRLEKSLTYDNI